MWGVQNTQEEGRRGFLRGVETGDRQRQACILRYPQESVSNTRVDEKRRRYHQQEGNNKDDDWVKVEPRRKKADRTISTVKRWSYLDDASDVSHAITTSRKVEIL